VGKRITPSAPVVWSSRLAAYLSTAGAAIGLVSIWRFPYLAGTGGGAFILVFVLACVLICNAAAGRGIRPGPQIPAQPRGRRGRGGSQ
jgi:hypothetical protein